MLQLDQINPDQYFQNLKDKKQTTNDEYLQKLYENSEVLLQKAFKIGQKIAIEKLLFSIETIEKERKLFEMGIDTFVHHSDIIENIEKMEGKPVKIIELKNYQREIPDEITEIVADLQEKKIFDEFFIVFTDYTMESAKVVEEERRKKDPIIFGAFLKGRKIYERLYFLGDWVDEHCSLTLDEMISSLAKKGIKIDHKIAQPSTIEEIKEYAANLEVRRSNESIMSFVQTKLDPKKRSIVNRIASWLTKK